MRFYQLFGIFIYSIALSMPVSAGFEWGDGGSSGSCDDEDNSGSGGSGSFKQEVPLNDIATIGDIPEGVAGVEIILDSEVDLDIQLYDKRTGDALVKWPDGQMSGSGYQTIIYDGIRIEWSGFNGDGSGLGNEYIRIFNAKDSFEPSHLDFEMKVYAFRSGVAVVNYSWESVTDQQKCENANAPSGNGSFQQKVLMNANVEVGQIPDGLRSVRVKLSSDEDVDIQLFDVETGEAIVAWPKGVINGGGYSGRKDIVATYRGMTIRYSGYNGDGTGAGHEYISIDGETTRPLLMEAFGYRTGYATVEYSWGQ